MKIRALANGHVIDADDEAAKVLIDAKIYEDAGNDPITNSLTPPVSTAVQPMTTASVPAKKGKSKK